MWMRRRPAPTTSSTRTLRSGNLDVAVPEPAAFIGMKLAAKGLRPLATKDCFDLYAYVVLRTPALVAPSLAKRDASGAMAASLRALFADVDKPGVADVLTFAASLSEDERALLARHVVDVFDETLAGCRALLR